MADVLTHYVVSFLLLRRIFNLKTSLLIALVALLPDIDVVFRVHRWFTHSIVVLGIAVSCLTLLLVLSKRYRKYILHLGVATLVYLLHIAIDLFTAPTPVLWPLVSESYHLKMLIQGSIARDEAITIYTITKISISSSDFMPREKVEGPLATDLGIILALATLTLELSDFMAKMIKNRSRGFKYSRISDANNTNNSKS
ncbi:MAG: metal-dependent hydrolase [Ignisphaera sp.]